MFRSLRTFRTFRTFKTFRTFRTFKIFKLLGNWDLKNFYEVQGFLLYLLWDFSNVCILSFRLFIFVALLLGVCRLLGFLELL